jgi:hypothetical protein
MDSLEGAELKKHDDFCYAFICPSQSNVLIVIKYVGYPESKFRWAVEKKKQENIAI